MPVGGFFMCVCVRARRTQHSNLFHIPKTNQAGYFHSGIGLMVEVGLNRRGSGATCGFIGMFDLTVSWETNNTKAFYSEAANKQLN